MAIVFVAKSATVTEWASDVGLGKNIFWIGVADNPEEALAELNKGHCGGADWTIAAKADAGSLTAEQAIERLAKREKLIDPKLYPRLRGAVGLFRVKTENVENHFVVKKALEGGELPALKLKPADFAAYLLTNAQR